VARELFEQLAEAFPSLAWKPSLLQALLGALSARPPLLHLRCRCRRGCYQR